VQNTTTIQHEFMAFLFIHFQTKSKGENQIFSAKWPWFDEIILLGYFM
jgi:hypothetical protein